MHFHIEDFSDFFLFLSITFLLKKVWNIHDLLDRVKLKIHRNS